MRCWCGAPVLAAVVIAFAAAPSTAAEAPLTFAQSAQLTTSCERLTEGIVVGVRNETAEEQQINLVPGEFADTDGNPVDAAEVCGGVEIEVVSSVPGGRSATATLRARENERDDLVGELSLFARKGGVSRREVSISPDAPKDPLRASPLIDERDVSVTGSVLGIWDSTGSIWIPVASKPGRNFSRQPVGVLTGTHGNSVVLFSGKSRSTHGDDAEVELELATGSLSPGSYSGVVDLDPSDPEGGEVKVSVDVARCVWIAILLLLAGIAVALALQRLRGRRIPTAALRSQISELSARHTKLIDRLRAAANGKAWGDFMATEADLAQLQANLDGQVNQARTRSTIDIDKEVLKSIKAAINSVRAELDLLGEIPPHARDLESLLAQTQTDDGETGLGRPELYKASHAAMDGEPIRSDQIRSRIEEIDARAKQVRSLISMQKRLGRLEGARDELEEKGGSNLDELDKALGIAKRLIWGATNAEDLDAAARELQGAAKAIASSFEELAEDAGPPAELTQWARSSRPFLARFAFQDQPIDRLSEESAAVEALEGPRLGDLPLPPSLPPSPPPPKLDSDAIDRETIRVRKMQRVAVGVAVLVAVATGLIALYASNSTWGSCWDLLAALIWGMGTQAAVTGIATSLDDFGSLRSSRS